MTPLEQLMSLLDKEEAAAILVAASRRFGEQIAPPDSIIQASELALLDDLAIVPYTVPQWTDAEGKTVGVLIRPLTLRNKIDAEKFATNEKGKVSEFKRIAYEVWCMICKPKLKSVDPLLEWNYDALLSLHNFGSRIAEFPAQLVAAELARLAGEPAPEPRKPTGPNRSE